jgi:hypothetical protein
MTVVEFVVLQIIEFVEDKKKLLNLDIHENKIVKSTL